MGWDAYAENADRSGLDRHWPGDVDERPYLVDPTLRDAFEAAQARIIRADLSVDGLLSIGGLDCSPCARALEAATGHSAWDPDGWSAEQVKELAASAVWPERLDPDPNGDAWAVASAREFLETCARHGLGIYFSW